MIQRSRAWLTVHHLAQVALLVQPLIVFRTGAECLRLQMGRQRDLSALVAPLFISIAAVAVGAIVSLLLYFNGRERGVGVLTLAGIVALIAHKLVATPTLG